MSVAHLCSYDGEGVDRGVCGGEVSKLAGTTSEASVRVLAVGEEADHGGLVLGTHRVQLPEQLQRVEDPVDQPRPAGVQTLVTLGQVLQPFAEKTHCFGSV